MRSLDDLQGAFARAMTTGVADGLRDTALVGGGTPSKRLEIHLRHYEASLTSALLEKYPACTWLAGGALVRDAACAYVRLNPPEQPCIAEYGGRFPQFLASYGRLVSLPYVESFGDLEWAFSQASIAVDEPPQTWEHLAAVGPERLVDATLTLQPGLHYCRSSWRIDELMSTYLRGEEPERFVLTRAQTLMEVRGARGTVSLARLDEGAFEFRTALARGVSIGDAAIAALAHDAAFDAGSELKSLVRAGLVTGLSAQLRE